MLLTALASAGAAVIDKACTAPPPTQHVYRQGAVTAPPTTWLHMKLVCFNMHMGHQATPSARLAVSAPAAAHQHSWIGVGY